MYSVEVYSVHGDKTTPGWSGKEGRVDARENSTTSRHARLGGLLFTFNYVIPDTIRHRGRGWVWVSGGVWEVLRQCVNRSI